MAYGIMINTTKGWSDLSDITTLRRVYTTRRTNSDDGSISIPADIAVPSSIAAVRSHDGGALPYVVINTSTNRLIWQDSQSSDFSIDIYRKD